MTIKDKIINLGDLSLRSEADNIKLVKYNREAILEILREVSDKETIYQYLEDTVHFDLDAVFIADGFHNAKSRFRNYVYSGVALVVNDIVRCLN